MKLRLLFLALLMSTLTFGQDVDKLEKKALKLFYSEELQQAAKLYEEILSIDSQNKNAKYRYLICNALLDPRNSSLEDLLDYKSTQGKKDKFYYYWLGRAYFHQNQFKKATESWKNFLALDKYKSSIIIEETNFFIEWAERAEAHHSFSENYEIEQLPTPINSPSTEYSPVYFSHSNELIYLSDINGSESEENFQVYHTIRQAGGWSEPTILKQFGEFAEINANLEVVNQSSKLYMYKGDKKGSLYVSNSNNGKWSQPNSLEKQVSDSKLESHFFINEQENIILFAKKKTNKTMDFDLYISSLDMEKDKWSKPELISPNLTSEKDENYPFLAEDGKTLYFSSIGFGSIGGYDVFRSEYDSTNNTWSEPVSLGFPTNSIGHDIQFKKDSRNNSGYFVSDRLNSLGSFDIFFFHPFDKLLFTGTITDVTGLPADGAEIHFLPSRKTGLEVKTMADENGKFEVHVGSNDTLTVEIFFNDELVYRESILTPVAKAMTLRKNFSIDKEKPVKEKLDVIDDPTYTDVDNIGSKFRSSNKALLSNIYFGFGEVNLRDSEKPKLDPLLKVMRENAELKVEIAGHTDNIGDGRANLRVSVLRARSVANYLTDNGIAKERVVAKGYGYAIPMASNDQEKEGRELNRRIEVLVLE